MAIDIELVMWDRISVVLQIFGRLCLLGGGGGGDDEVEVDWSVAGCFAVLVAVTSKEARRCSDVEVTEDCKLYALRTLNVRLRKVQHCSMSRCL